MTVKMNRLALPFGGGRADKDSSPNPIHYQDGRDLRRGENRFSTYSFARSPSTAPAAHASLPGAARGSTRVSSAISRAIYQPLTLLFPKFHPTDLDHTSEKIKSQSGGVDR
jgi:hypothetical protein